MIIDNLKEVWLMALLDFVLYHILSIHSHKDSGISTLKAVDNIHPKVALYDTIYPPSLSKYNTLSMEATALNICIISKTIGKLDSNPKDIMDTLRLSLEYQLYYCMENIKPDSLDISTLSALIEGCINTSILIRQTDEHIGNIASEKVYKWIHSLKCSLIRTIKSNKDNIYDLATATRILCLLNLYTPKYDHSDVIAMCLLEILERRNSLGLLEVSPLDSRIAPLSHHLFVIETLLMGRLHVGLYTIYEEAVSLFDKIYELSYNPASHFLSFHRRAHIRYTAKDLGLIIRSLNSISKWTEDTKRQAELESIKQDSYLKIVSKFMEKYHKSITTSTLNYDSAHGKTLSPLFPSELLITPPYPTVDWCLNKRRNLTHILFLCNCLLDIYELPQTDISPSYIDTFIDILLGILS